MRILKLCCLLAAVIGFSLMTQSCQKAESSADVNQDKIHQYLELYYNSREDKTYAFAQFRFGNSIGTPLELAANASIMVDGNAMTWNDAFNVNRYEWTWTGKVSSATFTYSDLDGNTFVNTANVIDADIPATVDTISKANSYDLIWTGTSLGNLEEAWVYINENQQANGALFKQSNLGSTSVTMTKSGMSSVDPNTITIWLDRHNNPHIDQATSAGGILKGRYRAVKDDVELVN